ncbi:MAG TPA: hypothetical protein PLH98_03680 [Ruminococcus flavefaciens]|nr:hypothetical protein [Ruminococcus flavefaciens]HQL99649.1 hypothetical protein [Ruminococcus flavefaciens]
MKKTTVFLTLAVMMVFCLAGCGGREAYAGKWEASEIVMNNSSITEMGGVPICALVRFELDKSGSAKWMPPMESVKDPSKEGVSARWKIKDGKLVMAQSGTEIRLVKVDEYTPVDEEKLSQILGYYSFSQMFGGQ